MNILELKPILQELARWSSPIVVAIGMRLFLLQEYPVINWKRQERETRYNLILTLLLILLARVLTFSLETASSIFSTN